MRGGPGVNAKTGAIQTSQEHADETARDPLHGSEEDTVLVPIFHLLSVM